MIVNATNGADVIAAGGAAGSASVTGLPATIGIAHAEAAQDTLTVNALGGDDVVEASGLAADAIRLEADGADGADVLIGGAGPDTLRGGAERRRPARRPRRRRPRRRRGQQHRHPGLTASSRRPDRSNVGPTP